MQTWLLFWDRPEKVHWRGTQRQWKRGIKYQQEHGKYFKMYEKKQTKGGLDETKIHPTARDTKKKNLKLIQKCRVTKRFSYTYNQSPLNIPLASNYTDFLTLLDINADFFLSFCVRTI